MEAKKEEIKAIFFDIGGILYDENTNKPFSKNLSKKFGVTPESIRKIILKNLKKAQTGKISARQFSDEVAKGLKIKDKKCFFDSWIFFRTKSLILMDSTKKLIRSFKKDYILGTLTNITQINDIPRIRKKVYEDFKIKLLSYKEGLRKPDPRFYQLMIKRTKLPSGSIVFIDDKKEFLLPAKRLGINTILFKNNNQLIKDLKKLGVKV